MLWPGLVGRSYLLVAGVSARLSSFLAAKPALALSALIFAVALAFRLPDLGASCNVDAVLYWFGRTRKFWGALAEGQFADMYYSPHPGVSIMWLSGASLHAAGIIDAPVTERSVVVAAAPLAVLASAVVAASVPLVYRILTTGSTSAGAGGAVSRGHALCIAALTGLLLASEPFLVAHARTFHLDATATGFVWLGCLLGILALLERRFGWAIAAGVCFGLAMLTRMLSGTFVAGLGVAFALLFLRERPWSARLPLLLLALGGTLLVTVFALWPALVADPAGTISRILKQTNNTVESGHGVFSWGEIHPYDAGPALYGGVFLMRLTPELLACALLGPFIARALPKRVLATVLVLACAYGPPALGLLMSSKKGDRYALLLFPLLGFVAAVCIVELGRRLRLPGRFAARSTLVAATFVSLLLGWRTLRLVGIHPMPIAWCAEYPGLRCEEVITLGNGEGFRDAALWIDANTPVRNPSVLSDYSSGAVLAPWLRFKRVRDAASAHFVVTYLSSEQRKTGGQTRRYDDEEPVHEVRYQDRTYVKIFLGPKHPALARGVPRD